MKFPRLDEQNDIQINLTPLIDVVFMMLVFFILTTNFIKENRLSLILPEAESRYPTPTATLTTVIVDASGNYVVNDKKLADNQRATLVLELQRARAEGNSPDLKISADARVAHSKVVLLMDVAGQLGFSNIRITTREANQF